MGLIGLMSLMSLMGCSVAETETASVTETGREPVAFAAYVAQTVNETRADASMSAERGIPDGKKIGVYAYYHQNSTWADDEAAGKATPSFMFNQPVTYDRENNSFTYSPLKYWPNGEDDKLSFIAYYPYTDPDALSGEDSPETTGIVPTLANDGTGLPTFDFVVDTDPDKQIDFIISALVADQQKPSVPGVSSPAGTGRIHLGFCHVTPKVKFHVTVTEDLRKDLASLKVKSLKVTNIYTKGTYAVTSEVGELEGTRETDFGTCECDSPEEFIIVKQDENPAERENHLGDVYLMVPQVLSDDAELEITYELTFRGYRTTYEYDEGNNLMEKQTYSYTKTATKKIGDLTIKEWEPNHQYIYNIIIGAEKMGFTGQVVAWGDEIEVNDIPIEEE